MFSFKGGRGKPRQLPEASVKLCRDPDSIQFSDDRQENRLEGHHRESEDCFLASQ